MYLKDEIYLLYITIYVYLQHPGMQKKCRFVKLQELLPFLRKNVVLQKKRRLNSVILNGFCARGT